MPHTVNVSDPCNSVAANVRDWKSTPSLVAKVLGHTGLTQNGYGGQDNTFHVGWVAHGSVEGQGRKEPGFPFTLPSLQASGCLARD